jgi:arsenate reductase (thioredoxin)
MVYSREKAVGERSVQSMANSNVGADTVVFACVHNAGRSQMAAAFFNALADPARARAVSVGTKPGERVHPVVVDAMRVVGIDLTGQRPQLMTDEIVRGAALLVTMGCGEECPFVPGLARDDWPLSDPKDRPIAEVREIRDDVRRRIEGLIQARCWTTAAAADRPASQPAS